MIICYFKEYEKKKREEEKIKQTEDIEEQRAEISRFLQKVGGYRFITNTDAFWETHYFCKYFYK